MFSFIVFNMNQGLHTVYIYIHSKKICVSAGCKTSSMLIKNSVFFVSSVAGNKRSCSRILEGTRLASYNFTI